MNNARMVCRAEGGSDLNGVCERLIERQKTLLQPVGQRLALEELHDEKRRAAFLTDLVRRADVRMLELRERTGFAVEALSEVRVEREDIGQDLEGHDAIEPRVARLVHLAHAARAEGRNDFVTAEPSSWNEGHTDS